MDSSLVPALEDDKYVTFRRHDTLPADVLHVYGEYPECALSLDRLRSGIDGLLEPLQDFGEGAWSVLRSRFDSAYFVDMRFQSRLDEAGALYVVVPLQAGFASIRLWCGMHECVFEQNDGGATLRRATACLPEFLRRTMRLAALVGIHHSIPYLQIPDVRWFYGREIGIKHGLQNDIKGTLRRKAIAKFGEQWDRNLHLLARDDDHNWSLIVDLAGSNDAALWVALREDFKDVRRVNQPQVAYEAMLVHYLSGDRNPFDFRSFAESRSMW
jgi:hypothetical protein